jgi:hypothetical protein
MAGKPTVWTPEKVERAKHIIAEAGSLDAAAQTLRVTGSALRSMCNDKGIEYRDLFRTSDGEVELRAPPSSDVPIEDLVATRIQAFARQKAHREARRLIPVKVKASQPLGILHFGDPHVDDDGTDLSLLQEHARLVRETPGLYAANVGDTTNNWVGRLAKLYGSQGTTEADGWRLAEWFIREVHDWLYMVAGNHDAWSGAGDPLRWIAAQSGAFYQDSEVRIALRFPGDREVRINCRHDFAGRSQYNPAHGPMKALFFGVRDHVAIAGHTHESAYGVLKDPDSGITMHAIKVASYKIYDRYALERGFRDQTLSPCAVTVIDPRLAPTHPDLVKVFWQPEEGASYLTWLRSRKAAQSAA